MRYIFLTLAALNLAMAAQAEVLTANVKGRAINTGVSSEVLGMRATANAIENFLLQNGSNLKSVTIVENGKLAFDQIRVNSEHRIFGLDITAQLSNEEYTEVSLTIYYGQIDQREACADRQPIKLKLSGIKTKISPQTPAFFINFGPQLENSLRGIEAQLDFLRLDFKETDNGQSSFQLDYSALTQSPSIAKQPNNHDLLDISVEISYDSRKDAVEARFITTSANINLTDKLNTIVSKASLKDFKQPLLLARTPKSREEIIEELISPYVKSFENALKATSCEPLKTKLIKKGTQYSVALGKNNGVSKASIFLLHNGGTTGFIVKQVYDHKTDLIPLQGVFPHEPQQGHMVYLVK